MEALAALGNENHVEAMATAYRRLKRDYPVRWGMAEAFSQLRPSPAIAIPLLREWLKDETDRARNSFDPGYVTSALDALRNYGDGARSALPDLLTIADTATITEELGATIAAIGITSREDASRLIRRYTESPMVYYDHPNVLRALSESDRQAVAMTILPWLEEGQAFGRFQSGLAALHSLAASPPRVVEQLESLVSGADTAVALSAADVLAAILAANPAAAQSILAKRTFPQQTDLVTYLHSLATDPSNLGGLPRERSMPVMRALARLGKVSPAAIEVMRALVANPGRTSSDAAGAQIRLEAIAGLYAADYDVSPVVLSAFPLPAAGAKVAFSWIDIEEQSQTVLADVLSKIGPSLAPSAPVYVRAFAAAKTAKDQRMLARALCQMFTGPSSAAASITPLLSRVNDHEARALLLAAYLNGGGEVTPVLDLIAKTIREKPGPAGGGSAPSWDTDWSLFEAITRRKQVRWNESAAGESVLAAFIADQNAGSSGGEWPRLVPFGPLSLAQSLMILDVPSRNSDDTNARSYWAAFLCPGSRAEIDRAIQLLLNRPVVTPTGVQDLRSLMPQLVALLDASPRDGELRPRVVRALAQTYGAGVSQWTGADEQQLREAATSLELSASGGGAETRASRPGASQEEAARTARSIRDRLAAARDVEVAIKRTDDVQRQAAADRQVQDSARRRLIALSSGLTGVLAFGLTMVLSVTARRRVLLLTGRRWSFVAAECDGTLEVSRGQAVFRPTAGPRPVLAAIGADHWPPSDSDVAVIKSELQPGWNIRILAEDGQFRRPWSHLIGSPWSDGAEAIVAGQLCLAPPIRILDWQAAKTIVFASFACADSPGLPRLPGVDVEVGAVERSFRRWGATVRCRTTNAGRHDVAEGLQNADIVHVAAHSTPAAIYLSDGAFDVSTLTALGTRPLRCRLLVLSSCEAGRLEPQHSLVYALVRSGANVVASLAPVNDDACVMFFEEFYAALLPSRAAQGIGLGASVRRAADCCRQRVEEKDRTTGNATAFQQWRATVDSFALYGDPTIQLRLISPAERRKSSTTVLARTST